MCKCGLENIKNMCLLHLLESSTGIFPWSFYFFVLLRLSVEETSYKLHWVCIPQLVEYNYYAVLQKNDSPTLVEIKGRVINADDDFYMQRNRIYSDIVDYEVPWIDCEMYIAGPVTIVLFSEGSCKNLKQVLLYVNYKNEIGFM